MRHRSSVALEKRGEEFLQAMMSAEHVGLFETQDDRLTRADRSGDLWLLVGDRRVPVATRAASALTRWLLCASAPRMTAPVALEIENCFEQLCHNRDASDIIFSRGEAEGNLSAHVQEIARACR